jgi:hypothetical protein
MKNILLLLTLVGTMFLSGCGSSDVDTSRDGLDLQAVLGLAQTSTSPQDFEGKLNQEGGVNNLDLNQDGKVDYLSVDEYETQGQRNLTLYVAYDGDNKQQVAEIVCGAEDKVGTCQIVGNDKVYGSSPVYQVQSNQSDNASNNFLMWYLILHSGATPYHTTVYNYSTPRTYAVRDYNAYKSVVKSPTYSSPSVVKASINPSTSSRISSSPVAGKTTSVVTRSSMSSRGYSTGSSSSRTSAPSRGGTSSRGYSSSPSRSSGGRR